MITELAVDHICRIWPERDALGRVQQWGSGNMEYILSIAFTFIFYTLSLDFDFFKLHAHNTRFFLIILSFHCTHWLLHPPPLIEQHTSLLHLHYASHHRHLLRVILLSIHSRRCSLHSLDPCNTSWSSLLLEFIDADDVCKTLFGDCVYGWQDSCSVLLGYLSILCWLNAQLPWV